MIALQRRTLTKVRVIEMVTNLKLSSSSEPAGSDRAFP
jgi:hypothetical protein